MSNGYVATILSILDRKKFSRRKNNDVYRKVITLRKEMHTYSEIIKETGVSKSTISTWLSHAGLTLTKEQLQIQRRKRVMNYVIATEAARVTKAKRSEREVNLFISQMRDHFSDPFFVAGIMLYEAEGRKVDNFEFSNSDYRLHQVFLRFLRRYILADSRSRLKRY